MKTTSKNFIKPFLFIACFASLLCVLMSKSANAACGTTDLICTQGNKRIDCSGSNASTLKCRYTDSDNNIDRTFSNSDWKGMLNKGYEFRDCITKAYVSDPTGSKAYVCSLCRERNNDGHWSQRGAMWIKSSTANGIIELTNINNNKISANLYGGSYDCGDGSSDMSQANRILFVTESTGPDSGSAYKNKGYNTVKNSNIIDTSIDPLSKGTKVSRGKRQGNYKWSKDANPNKIYFNDSSSILSGNPSNGIYTKTIYIWRCPVSVKEGEKNEAGDCYSDAPSYVRLAKIATFSHSNSASYNGEPYGNEAIITIPKETESATINFTHTLKRTDGWTTTGATTNYTLANNAANLSEETNSFTSTFQISDSKNTGTIAQDGETTVCSYVTYKNVTGLDGYNRPRASGDTSVSKICVKVRRAGEKGLSVSGSSTVSYGGETQPSLNINLDQDKESAKVTFTHKISRGDKFAIATPVNHSISESLDGSLNGWEVGTGWPDGTVSETLKQSALTKTYSFDKTIKVNQGESKTVCQTLYWTPTKFTFAVDDDGNPTGDPDGNGASESTQACATVKRVKLTGRSPKEKSSVTIASVNDDNGEDTKIGVASLTGAKTNTKYRANFTHQLKLDEPFDAAEVSYTIKMQDNDGNITNRAQGSVSLSSSDWQLALSDAQDLEVDDWGKSNQICQWVEYSPTLFAFIDGTYEPTQNSGSRTTYKVCASVTSPDAQEVTLSARTEATTNTSALPPKDLSQNGKFHFNHTLTNNNEGNLNATLPTIYTVYYKVIKEVRDSEGNVTKTDGTYTTRSGKTQIDVSVNYSNPTNVIDEINYAINPNERITICEYINLTYSRFKFATDNTENPVERSTALNSDEKCASIYRPGLVTTYGPDIEITGNSDIELTGETSKLHLVKETTTEHDYLIGSTTSAGIDFVHSLTRNNVANSSTINPIYYLFENSNSVASSDIKNKFITEQSKSIENNSTISVTGNVDFKNRQAITGNIGVGKTQSDCRNVYFKNNIYKISYGYYYDWDGNRLNVPGTPIVTQTPDDSINDGIGNSDLVCASITRPYNFHVEETSLKATGVPSITYPGEQINSTYSFDVKKSTDTSQNWNDFFLTGIPNAEFRLFSLIFKYDEDDDSLPDFSSRVIPADSSPEEYLKEALNPSEIEPLETVNYNITKESVSKTSPVVTYSENSFNATFRSSNYYIPSRAPGEKFCTVLALSPYDSGKGLSADDFNRSWILSGITCSNIGKKPTMQVHGSSVFSPAEIDASKTSLLLDKDTGARSYFSSWSDFSLISRKEIKGASSGAALSGGNENSAFCAHSPLTIANADCENNSPNELGKANIARAKGADEFFTAFQSRFVNTNNLESNLSDSRVKLLDDGKISEDDENPKVYYSKGDIRITDDLEVECSGSCADKSEIPQILILANGNVYIESNVKRVDAWIVTKGTLNTCSDSTHPTGYETNKLTSDDCADKLTINGPIITNNIILPRTYGADASEDLEKDNNSLLDPAELINYNPSALLWGYNWASSEGVPNTTYLKELAPRY